MYFRNKRLNNGITMVEDCSATKMYLVEGTERALLIDTGVGFAGLKEYVEGLTDLPFDVLITHAHLDHAGGIRQFDRVYMSHRDIPILEKALDREARLDYARGLCGEFCSPDSLSLEAFPDLKADPEITDIEDGSVFDLGGRRLTVIAAPGHTSGMVALYDDLSESLFLGDSCNPSSYLFLDESVSIEQYLDSLEKLVRWSDKTRRCYFQHNYGEITCEGPVSVITDVLECVRAILDRSDAAIPFYRDELGSLISDVPLSANELDEQLMRKDGKLGNVIYSPTRIYKIA